MSMTGTLDLKHRGCSIHQAAACFTRPHVRGLASRRPSRRPASHAERRRWQAHSDNAEQARLFDVPVQPYNPDVATSRHSQLSSSPLQLPCRSSPAPEETEPRHWLWDAVAAHGASVRQTAVAFALAGVLLAGPAVAADVAKVGTCLLGNCQVALAKCLADGECLENLVCLQLCNGRKDETECQIRCGDLYADKAVEAFTACAVSDKKCVPQRVDEVAFPVPPECALDKSFDLNNFQGRWYITAGLNPLFDTFDCQVHYFGVPEPGKLYGKINWRIPKGNADFIERSTVQTFDQKLEVSPAYLRNDGNEYLHYTDDWYILDSQPDKYVVIYYRGNNDAWKGYGGATIYTRESSLPEEYVPKIKEAVQKVGLKWSDFKMTDNTCKPHPPPTSVVAEVEDSLEKEVKQVTYELEGDLKSFGKGFTVIEQGLIGELAKDEQGFVRELQKEEKLVEQGLGRAEAFLERIERTYTLPPWLRWLYSLGLPMPSMPNM